MAGKLQLTYIRSTIGYSENHKRTVRALGFHHLNETIVKEDTPAIRGMLRRVSHMVKVVELAD